MDVADLGGSKADQGPLLQIDVKEAQDLMAMDAGGANASDPYVKVRVAGIKKSTGVINNDNNPQWMKTFRFDLSHVKHPENAKIEVRVMDKDTVGGDDFLGKLALPVQQYMNGKVEETWHTLLQDDGQSKSKGRILLRIHYLKEQGEIEAALAADGGGGGWFSCCSSRVK